MKGYITREGSVTMVASRKGHVVCYITLADGRNKQMIISFYRARHITLKTLPELFALVK